MPPQPLSPHDLPAHDGTQPGPGPARSGCGKLPPSMPGPGPPPSPPPGPTFTVPLQPTATRRSASSVVFMRGPQCTASADRQPIVIRSPPPRFVVFTPQGVSTTVHRCRDTLGRCASSSASWRCSWRAAAAAPRSTSTPARAASPSSTTRPAPNAWRRAAARRSWRAPPTPSARPSSPAAATARWTKAASSTASPTAPRPHPPICCSPASPRTAAWYAAVDQTQLLVEIDRLKLKIILQIVNIYQFLIEVTKYTY